MEDRYKQMIIDKLEVLRNDGVASFISALARAGFSSPLNWEELAGIIKLEQDVNIDRSSVDLLFADDVSPECKSDWFDFVDDDSYDLTSQFWVQRRVSDGSMPVGICEVTSINHEFNFSASKSKLAHFGWLTLVPDVKFEDPNLEVGDVFLHRDWPFIVVGDGVALGLPIAGESIQYDSDDDDLYDIVSGSYKEHLLNTWFW